MNRFQYICTFMCVEVTAPAIQLPSIHSNDYYEISLNFSTRAPNSIHVDPSMILHLFIFHWLFKLEKAISKEGNIKIYQLIKKNYKRLSVCLYEESIAEGMSIYIAIVTSKQISSNNFGI